MLKLVILLILFVCGGFLLFPEWSWGFIWAAIGIGMLVCAARKTADSPLVGLGGLGATALAVVVTLASLGYVGGEDAVGGFLSFFNLAPWWVYIVGGFALGGVLGWFFGGKQSFALLRPR